MGVDIHMFIVNENKNILKEDIFDGRNSEWFRNLQDCGNDSEYDYCPIVYGWQSVCSEDLVKKYADRQSYYGHFHISVKLFKDWFEKYNPHKKAGWVTTYEKWEIENHGYCPENFFKYSLDKDDIIEDMHFIEWVNVFDCSLWLYNYLKDNKIPDNAWIVYCFDC